MARPGQQRKQHDRQDRRPDERRHAGGQHQNFAHAGQVGPDLQGVGEGQQPTAGQRDGQAVSRADGAGQAAAGDHFHPAHIHSTASTRGRATTGAQSSA